MDLPRLPPLHSDDSLFCSEDKIFDMLSHLDISKAAGPDGISARMLKETAISITSMITTIFNMSISTGVLPAQWKKSLVVPIPKSGDSSNPANYRPISLLSIVSKLLERHICDLLLDHFEVSPQQWGFQEGKSTTNAILSAVSDWYIQLENGFEVLAVFFDLQKAFDSVPHSLLLQKLYVLGIPCHLIRWIANYLYDRSQQVAVDGELSPYTSVVSGVPQGSVLGPILFLIYIDGLCGIHLSSGNTVLFADDLLLHNRISQLSDFIALQKDVDELCNWLNNYSLTLNAKKCKSLLISRKKQPIEAPVINVKGHPLERVTAYKYLGILITSDLSWSSHIQAITTKARKQTGMLYRRFYNNSQPSTLKTLYIALIRPLLEYGVPVWDPHLRKDINLLESVQKFATKLCTKSWSAHSYDERLHLLNLDSLSKRRAFLKLCHLYKLVHGQSASYNLPINFSNNSLYPTRFNHSLTLEVPFSHSNSYFYSFFCDAVRVWNTLPYNIVSSSFHSFKQNLSMYLP